MTITEIKREHTASANATPDPKLIKLAKLAVVLADKEVSDDTKLTCVRLAVRTGIVTEEEGNQLLLYKAELEEVLNHEDQEEV